MLKNMLRHFFVGLGAITYLTLGFTLVYQYLGLMNGWPGIFLSVIHEASGDWWLDVDWSSPVLLGTFVATACMAAVYATIKRHDEGSYRDTEVESASGF